ncbi:hypothetical protein [Clostridium perfringens]|uniref:hypothetical protein n=1 Tax=Clostridium perfringens TaxID=1502 RepID=UPI002245D7AD|nr:hypothetical protein [Clostridium perfringens]MCX0403258.1 hypothetical protein [Clostridium perfringens]
MKLTIENLEDEKIKLTLNFNGKDYTEIWEEYEYGYKTINDSIVTRMEKDGICCEGTDIEMLLCNLDIASFKEISDDERVW